MALSFISTTTHVSMINYSPYFPFAHAHSHTALEDQHRHIIAWPQSQRTGLWRAKEIIFRQLYNIETAYAINDIFKWRKTKREQKKRIENIARGAKKK